MADRRPIDEQAAPAFVAAKKALSALYARPRVDRLWEDLTGLKPDREREGEQAAPGKPRAVA